MSVRKVILQQTCQCCGAELETSFTLTEKTLEEKQAAAKERTELMTGAFEKFWKDFAGLHHTAGAGSKQAAATEWAVLMKGRPEKQQMQFAELLHECMLSDDTRIGQKLDSREFAPSLPQAHRYLKERRFKSSVPFLHRHEQQRQKKTQEDAP